jgi:hypothetical protein
MSNLFKFLFVFLLSQNYFFGQINARYSFDTFLVGKINNTNIDDVGESFVIQNSSDKSYILEVTQYKKGNNLAVLFDSKNLKRIYFEFDFKFSKIQDINRLIKKNIETYKDVEEKSEYKDSIYFEKDTLKNELIVRSFLYKEEKRKTNVVLDFIYVYSNADILLADKEFMNILKNFKSFGLNCKNKYIKKFLNINSDKIYVEINYVSFEQYKYKIILNE